MLLVANADAHRRLVKNHQAGFRMKTAKPLLTATAGEHFVAHKIALLGFLPALVRQGSPSIDIVASSPDGGRTVGIQVKTTSAAVRTRGRGEKKAPFELQFPLGYHAIESTADSTIFCFVDLRGGDPAASPDVYVVPAHELKKEYAETNIRQYSYFRHHREVEHMSSYKNNWHPIVEALEDACG